MGTEKKELSFSDKVYISRVAVAYCTMKNSSYVKVAKKFNKTPWEIYKLLNYELPKVSQTLYERVRKTCVKNKQRSYDQLVEFNNKKRK